MAINSQGSKIQHASAASSPSSYQDIEEVTSIGGPDGTLNLIDVSHLQSSRKEYLPWLADNGTITLACNFTAGAQQMALFDMFNNSSDPEEFRIKVPTTSARTNFYVFDFLALVSKWSLADAVDSKVVLNITLQTTGGVHYGGITS